MNASAEVFGYASEMAERERANPSGSLTSWSASHAPDQRHQGTAHRLRRAGGLDTGSFHTRCPIHHHPVNLEVLSNDDD